MSTWHLGIDIGSISINTIVLDADRRVVEDIYTWCRGRPFHQLGAVLDDLMGRRDPGDLGLIAFTGTGGPLAAELVGGQAVNEIVAQSLSVAAYYPQARAIIEMGGEDSKLITLTAHPQPGVPAVTSLRGLDDFAMNGMCAAGTGSFLDQQARRMGISIDREFGELALRSDNPPRIAGRCSVFAKSDMIHLQQIATPIHDIAAGLCLAVARNFRSNLARGREIPRPVVFQGGVAANAGMVRAFRDLLGLEEGELIIPVHHASMGAIGAVLQVLDGGTRPRPFRGLETLEAYLAGDRGAGQRLERLKEPEGEPEKRADARFPTTGKLPVYLGLDVGSLSTNVVLIDDEDRVVARRYLPTASQPLVAIQRGLSEIAAEVGDRVVVMAAGSTGSGRYLTGDFVGADVIQNEITAQATAAIAHDPTVDTIFEIGGQDSKYISVDQGVVVDFEMNKVCAAGTGSFLEEQAEKLGIRIEEEFASLALQTPHPASLGDRCTVFMESDLNGLQQKGASTADLVGGLAYSIVQNYLQKVVGTKRVGSRIFFQGGVANNRAVVAAFQAVTGKRIVVPPHFDVTGAIGAAMIARGRARERGAGFHTRFKGFEVGRVPYRLERFTCAHCANQCDIRKVVVGDRPKPLFYGGRCERWEVDERKDRGKRIPNLFRERLELLRGDYREDEPDDGRQTVGIPRALMVFYQMFPFWRTFFQALGFRVVVSRPTDRDIIQRSLEMLTAETCFPAEVVYGHIMDLVDRGVDWVFAPFVVTAKAEPGNPTRNYNCPWVQTYPFMVRAALRDSPPARKLLTPALHFRYPRVLTRDLVVFARQSFGLGARAVRHALKLADREQAAYERALEARGRAVLRNPPQGVLPAVILGRPYNTGDPALNLNLVDKLIDLDVLPIPMDYLPLGRVGILRDYPSMYWPNGQKILAASRIVARDPALYAVSLGNFRCGPDSFLSHMVRKEMAGKPYLQLEVDEHSADAGMITRCEAFRDSLRGWTQRTQACAPGSRVAPSALQTRRPGRPTGSTGRTLYFPYMSDGAYALAAASRSCGVDAQVLPMQDEVDLKLARAHTTGRECFPMICTLGSFLKKMREPGFVPSKTAFFMPDHGGPCRFGQYNRLDRMVFDDLGYTDVEIVAPSNEDAYAGLSGGHGNRFRLAALKGIVAVDLLRKLRQERVPYETHPGSIERAYRAALGRVVRCVEDGARDIVEVMVAVTRDFRAVPLQEAPRRPVIAVVGEIFMRDNPYCSGHLVERLERLGAETLIAPFKEWMTYSTLRYARDSRWKGDLGGRLRAAIQHYFTGHLMRMLEHSVHGMVEMERDVEVERMLDLCEPYVHRDYDGDPALAMGASVALARTGISGVANILPFTCLPGTLIGAVSGSFRKDHGNLPWVNVDFDGQEDTALGTRLEAFVHQARRYAQDHGHDTPRAWGEAAILVPAEAPPTPADTRLRPLSIGVPR